MEQGKIIAVVGSIASGKSFLVRNLGKEYNVETFLEGEDADFPDFIKKNLANAENYLQTELYFLNQGIRHYLNALELKKQGRDVVLDTYWMTVRCFLESALSDPNEQQLLKNLINAIAETFPSPDAIVFLDATDELLTKRIKERGRAFEENAAPVAHAVSRAHQTFFANPENIIDSRLLIVDPEKYDLSDLAEQIGLTYKAE